MSYRFEQLDTWQIARTFVNKIYSLTKQFPKDETFGLTIQLKRAALSILLNITEGSDRKSDVEFIRFLRIAYTSMEEVIAGLYIALDQNYIEQQEFEVIYEQSNELGKKINSLIKYLKNNQTIAPPTEASR
ncbi:MAG TPA: four helix bundle protein [Candidatus Magasanikbacteria bacterium]|nr:four helix bundle protein [Candidatus Magasanikbacteria bacterium]